MSIQTELTRITNAKAAIKTAIEGKGVTVPNATLLDGMAALIAAIESGGGANYGTVIYEKYSQILTLGVPIPEDNFLIAILPTKSKSGSLGGSYLFHGMYRKINGTVSAITQGTSSSSANTAEWSIDRSANTANIVGHYFKENYEYAWIMGALA